MAATHERRRVAAWSSRSENVIASVVNAAKRLVGANPGTNVCGIVVDERGTPASKADVRVLGRRFVRADSNGRFEVEDLEPGDYEIIADWTGPWSGPRKNGVRQAVRSGGYKRQARAPRRSNGHRTRAPRWQAADVFRTSLVGERESPSGGMPIGVRDEDGYFALRHVLPGTWRIALMASGTRLATSGEFTVTKTRRSSSARSR